VTTKRRALGRGLAALIPAAAGPPPAAPAALPAAASAAAPLPASGGTTPHARHAPASGLRPEPGSTAPALGGGWRPAAAPADGLRRVGIEEVHPAREQPRKAFDDGRLDELAASIRTQGLIQPLVVRMRAEGGYELVAGERRWRAAQRAGLHEVPVVIRDVAAGAAFELAMVENLQREDLNAIEEAEGYEWLIRELGYTQESLAARVGRDRSTVANALRLLKLPPGVRAQVVAGRLSMGHARALLSLENLVSPDAMERLGRRIAAREMSVRQVEELVRREREAVAGASAGAGAAPNEGQAGGSHAHESASARDLAARLQQSLGTRVRVVESDPEAGSGHLEIHYASLDQLDGLLAKLLP
jgi:ParB family chromosome partitioning protein